MAGELGARVLSGDLRAVARLISLLEDGSPEGREVLAGLAPRFGSAQLIGLTGPPGSGKSSLADKLIREFRRRDLRVGVLAVDPSSPFSGGAILGDRLRMQSHATDPGVFIRSLASRGRLGGLSAATALSARALEAAGYDIVLVETVGVGQSEIDVVKVADAVVLVSVPGLGDEIQVIKAGIMEIGDVFVVNKADKDGADRVAREIKAMLETQAQLRRGRAASPGPDSLAAHSLDPGHALGAAGAPGGRAGNGRAGNSEPAEELPPVLKTVAETGEGVAELADLLLGRHAKAKADGSLERRRLAALKAQLEDLAKALLAGRFSADGPGLLEDLARAVLEGKKDLYAAAAELYEAGLRGGTS